MKVKLFHLFYITLFLAACLLPFVGMAVFGPSDGGTAEKPALFHADGSFNWQVLDETEQYIADRFALRQELTTLWAQLNARLFDTSVCDAVILGEDGWLYDAQTLDDYMGVTMSEQALTYGARNLYLMQEYAQSQGARFLFVTVPNKNSLYPEAMPDYYSAAEVSDRTLLAEALAELDVSCVDLCQVFRQEPEVLYHKTDSHWTGRGAALAADTILQELHKSTNYFDGEFSVKTARTGDLYGMLYPKGLEPELVLNYSQGFTFTVTGEDPLTTQQTGARDSLLCWGDSFGDNLYPYLAEVYESASFVTEPCYDLTVLAEQKADAVIIELAEKDLHRLGEIAPALPAPKRSIAVEAYGRETLWADAAVSAGGLYCVTVTVPEALTDSGSCLYIKIGDAVYEGCVACGEDVLQCSVYVPQEIPKAVELIAVYQGQYTLYSCVVGS